MKIFTIGNKQIGIKDEIIVPIFMLIFALAYFVQTFGLSKQALAFPGMFMALLFVTSLFSIKSCVSILADDVTVSKREPLFGIKLIKFLLVLLAFTISLPYIGIYVGIPAFVVLEMLVLGAKDIKLLIWVPTILLLGIYLVFSAFLKTPLPVGTLFKAFF